MSEDSNVEQDPNIHDIDPNRFDIPVTAQLSVALGILLLVFAGSYVPSLFDGAPTEATPTRAETTPDTTITRELPAVTNTADPFSDISLSAESAYVWDVKGQRALYKKNADEQLPLASITKLMTTLVAYELLGNDSDVTINMDAINQEGDSGFYDGETFSLLNLTDLTLITSSNDGAFALASAAGAALVSERTTPTFVEAMNIRAEEIGLSQTYFKNPTGLDLSETEAGAYGSARDIAFLMEYIITHHPAILEGTQEELTKIADENGAVHLAQNTNHTVYEIPGLIASKTGYTTLAGGNLVIAFDAGLNRPMIAVVLGSTRNERFTDIQTLTAAARSYVTTY